MMQPKNGGNAPCLHVYLNVHSRPSQTLPPNRRNQAWPHLPANSCNAIATEMTRFDTRCCPCNAQTPFLPSIQTSQATCEISQLDLTQTGHVLWSSFSVSVLGRRRGRSEMKCACQTGSRQLRLQLSQVENSVAEDLFSVAVLVSRG